MVGCPADHFSGADHGKIFISFRCHAVISHMDRKNRSDKLIYLYSGTPGSGKSLHTADKLYWRLRAGKPVIANFTFRWQDCGKNPHYLYINNMDLTPERLINFSRNWFACHKFHEGAITLVIDESQILFNSRDWNAAGRGDWLSFFTQHRKYGYDVILVAQFDKMLDRQIRALIEYECIHRKVSNFGIWGKIFSLFAGGKLFVCVKVWYPMKEKVRSEFFRAKKKYYQLYDSYADFGA